MILSVAYTVSDSGMDGSWSDLTDGETDADGRLYLPSRNAGLPNWIACNFLKATVIIGHGSLRSRCILGAPNDYGWREIINTPSCWGWRYTHIKLVSS